MSLLGIILILIFILLFLYLIITLVRIYYVGAYLQRVIQHIYNNNMENIANNNPNRLSYDVVNSTSYTMMVLQLWRSFDSYFPEEYRP